MISDYVVNLMATVIDFQTHTTTVERALAHFHQYRASEVRTFDDVEALLVRYPDDKDGNTALAQYLWGYKMWTRAQMLRGSFDTSMTVTYEIKKPFAPGQLPVSSSATSKDR